MNDAKGFTLTELLVTVMIVAILVVTVTPLVSTGLQSKAAASEGVGILASVENACKMYALYYDKAPTSLSDLISSGMLLEKDLRGTYFTESEIQALLGDGNIPFGNRGLEAGCGTVNGVTICKMDKGGYSISGGLNNKFINRN